MKSLMLLLRSVLSEEGTGCCISTTRDLKTIESRVEDEGYSFLTITLANFGKDFRKSLDQGFVGHDQFLGFTRAGGLPRFLGGFLDHVFDRSSGRLLDNPRVDCILAISQITLMFAKVNLPCTKARERKAAHDYVQCERELKDLDKRDNTSVFADFSRVALNLWGDILSLADGDVYHGNIIPAHGPGTTADSLFGNEKWENRMWTKRLDSAFSCEDVLIPNHRYHSILDDFEFIEPGEEIPVEVLFVPKTLKTPRVIAREPTVMMFMQQGLAQSITKHVEADDLARQVVGWQSQTPNQVLACQGSATGSLATLDLSEASDRVSNRLVRKMLSHHRYLRDGVEASRSRKAVVPEIPGIIRLSKFASMGSALTFPIESLVFATIVFLGIEKTLNRPMTRRIAKRYVGRVRIYGDDIIIPVEFVPAVVELLEDFGLKVNSNKSFWSGKFRESCGGEYYDGQDITIVRVRQVLPTNRRDVQEIISTVSLRNQLYQAGLWATAGLLDDLLGRLIPFPAVLPTSPGLGRTSCLGYDTESTDTELHRPLVKAMVVRSTIPVNELDGVGALHKILSSKASTPFGGGCWESSELPTADREHLKRSGRPRRVSIKPRMVVPF